MAITKISVSLSCEEEHLALLRKLIAQFIHTNSDILISFEVNTPDVRKFVVPKDWEIIPCD